jgi:hypothetical protein
MKFYYGYDEEHLTDITDIVFNKCFNDRTIFIPNTDPRRSAIFGDPYYGHLKYIKIVDHLGKQHIFLENRQINITFPSISQQLSDLNNMTAKQWYNLIGKFIEDPVTRLNTLHSYLKLSYGSMNEEYPEQLLAMRFINENSKVLEIGGNIGRNTLIIDTILNDSKNLVSLESDTGIAEKLMLNIVNNGYESYVENSALSLQPLMQKGWNTVPRIGELPEGWKKVSSISFADITKKYKITFDTLVADCEGALYYILKDDRSILDNIKLIIIENDFTDITHKEFVNKVFIEKGFHPVYHEAGGWGPCEAFFYEVWQKN